MLPTYPTLDEFQTMLAQHVRPSSPTESFEHLFDRENHLDRIEEALSSPGRHVFIYGDRGAGKTSLAKTAAFKHHPSSSEPIYTACGQNTSFSDIIRDIASQIDGRSEYRGKEKSTAGRLIINFGHFNGGVDKGEKITEKDLGDLDLNAATAALKEVFGNDLSRKKAVIVIDEFENLPSVDDRHLFAELIKQISDRTINVSLIFCGIGQSLDDLLEGHGSAHRYIEEVKLPSPPLSFTGRWRIIDSACFAFGMRVNEDSRLRIAQVSDGFPHYIHLILQKLLWSAYRSPICSDEFSPEDYMDAIREALGSVESRLRKAYDDATKKDQDGYEEVLWAVADHYELIRNINKIYDTSYCRIMNDIGKEPMDYDKFKSRLANLKSARHGSILTSDRRSWIRFSENLIRGYVRLVAESKNVRLALEHEPGPEPKKVTASAGGAGIDPIFTYPSFGRNSK